MTERQLVNLESKFSEGNYYDLLQSYKALYFRFSAQKKYKETVSLLMSGTMNFLKYQQFDCASELAKLLIEAYRNFKTPYSAESKANIIKLLNEYKDNTSHGKINFMRDAIKWSSEFPEESSSSSTSPNNSNKGSPELHKLLGDTLTDAGDYVDAQKHYLFGDSPMSFCRMLKKWVEESENEDENDLYITRAVLGYLCLKKTLDANQLLTEYTKEIDRSNFTPLLNYIRYLLLTLDRDALPLFNLLKQKYEPSLKRDPQFSKYLDQIANVYFNVPISSGGGLGSILSNLFGGLTSPQTNSRNNNSSSSETHMEID
ncbi:DUF410 family protein [Tieghemostelium lacteum]|uniref:DUF410 family protein n=1 Tax=Tieghemostelium lacteum TaxID=361077 RepID=A0A151ZHS6_TIELA|nr:DUF410 family protein [Tieghemostelium lacteum]|eukprot:KYQ93449.1 DUF410 family protein [Tieghemostelium lacteum]